MTRPTTPLECLGVSSGGKTTSRWPDVVGNPIKEVAMVTVARDHVPEHTTVTRVVVVIAVVEEA